MSDDGNQIAELIGEVRKLEGTNSATARVVRDLQNDVVALDGRYAENTEQLRRRTRNTLVLVMCVALLLAGLAVAGIYAARYFSCRNDVNAQFFAAEQGKVTGQIRGVDRQVAGIDALVAARDSAAGLAALHEYRAGALQFKQASQDYLNTIGRISAKC